MDDDEVVLRRFTIKENLDSQRLQMTIRTDLKMDHRLIDALEVELYNEIYAIVVSRIAFQVLAAVKTPVGMEGPFI